MTYEHYQPQQRRRGAASVLRGLAAAIVLVAATVGLPWMFLTLAGSPIPGRLPGWQEFTSALSRRDDGTLLLGFIKYLAWAVWLVWTALVLLESASQLRGRSAPQIPGLGGPQQLAALLISSLGATVIGTSVSISRASALPASPPNLTVSTAPPHVAYTPSGVGTTESPSADQEAPMALPVRPAGAAERPFGESGRTSVRSRSSAPRHQTVRFAFDSTGLSSAAKGTLAQVAEDIRQRADRTQPVILIGHTDSMGPTAYNQRLSVQRAQAVREALGHLAGHGFRFQVSGKGETDPIANETRPNGADDPAGRARNRRVEITYTLSQATKPAPPSKPHPTASRHTSPPEQQPPTTAPSKTPEPSSSTPNSGSGVPTAPSTTQPASPSPPDRHQPSPALRLPTGALVGLGLASAISIAVAASRLHRRRRRTPNPDRLTIAEPEPPSPPSIRDLRKAHLESYIAAGQPVPPDDQLVESDFTTKAPTDLTVGMHDGQQVTMALAGLNVGFTGPGATDAIRALATELLASAHRSRVELLIPERTAATVFDLAGDDLAELADLVPDLIVTPDLDAALRHLETEILHRSRMMSDHDVADIAALRTADPDEPLPTIVLITEIGESERFTATLQATLQIAERHGIGGLMLGPWPAGTTCHIGIDSQMTSAEGPDSSTWANTQLFHLPTTDTADLLQVIRTARGAESPAPTQDTESSDQQNAHDEHLAQTPAPPEAAAP